MALTKITGSGLGTLTSDVDAQGSSGATLKLTSTDTTGADTELLGQIDFVSSDASTGSAGTQARIKGVYEDNGDSSGLEFFCGNSTGSGTPTLFKRMTLSHDGENPAASIITDDNLVNLALISTDADASGGPGLDLRRDSSSPADGDDIGYIRFRGDNSNGDEHTYGFFQAKALTVTDGSEDGGIELLMNKGGTNRSRMEVLAGETVFNEDSVDVDFRVESDNNASALFVQGSNGNVGILTQAPDARLEIHDGGASSNTQLLQVHSDSTSFTSQLISIFAERNTTNSTFNAIRYFNTGASANRFIVRDSGNVENTNNSYGAISDETVKKNITDAASQWDDIKALTVRKFHLNEQDDTDPKMIGVVAQEIEKVSAGLVTTAYDEGEERDIKTVKYSVLYMKAVKALQEAMTRIETLEAKVKALESA